VRLVLCSFCHADFQHLSSNLFMLYVFGRSVEADEGGVAVWATYLVCALGAAASHIPVHTCHLFGRRGMFARLKVLQLVSAR